ncbi:nucleotidyltransferase family protein [Paenibacillus typhae]|uniref:nucleotidyltransferase family protein n=1 Tax=Paenibacillus typhae TaxID=1174501 RepID=UPI001C8E5501|nr:nucleotidyltransferase family protein [Paenibacillus typhae]MBY0014255.1 nucleotidyltransferase family protein [Paenibacillus typhae]
MKKEHLYLERLTGMFSESPLLMDVFRRARFLEPLPYYVGAGYLVQTVWNQLTGRPAEYGISDIDLVYFDPADLSFEAESEQIAEGRKQFNGVPVPLDIKNQARVHLWYENKFGIRLQPYSSLEAAIDSWPTTVTSLGARLEPSGEWRIYAPFGLADLYSLTVRPNKALISEAVYRSKTEKWHSKWPELQIIPWEDSSG